jgi:hypothetical protein
MIDQSGGPNETGETDFKPHVPDAHASDAEGAARPQPDADAPLSGRTRIPPVIEGVAVEARQEPEAEIEAPSGTTESAPEGTAESASEVDPPESEPLEADPGEPAAPRKAEKPRKSPSLVAATAAGVVALGAGGYYGWTEFVAPSQQSALIAEAYKLIGIQQEPQSPETTPPRAASPQDAAQSQETKIPEIPSSAPAPVEPPKAEGTLPPAAVPTIQSVTRADAPAAEAPQPPTATAPKGEDRKLAEPEPAPKATVEAPASAPGESVKTAADEKLAQVTAQLTETRAALAQVTQRLKSVEGQLAAPKADNRAELEARANGLSRANDASARVILAQSLLAALRQGDDFSSQVSGLQWIDGDSPRIVSLREGLSAPSIAKLAADFTALAPKLAAAAAPQPQASTSDGKPQEAAGARNVGASILSFLQVRAEKLVKVHAVGAPESDDETAARLKRIEQDLRRGELAAALGERLHLPEPALVLSADWAKGAQARLDAEMAAKAELSEALQALSKSRT